MNSTGQCHIQTLEDGKVTAMFSPRDNSPVCSVNLETVDGLVINTDGDDEKVVNSQVADEQFVSSEVAYEQVGLYQLTTDRNSEEETSNYVDVIRLRVPDFALFDSTSNCSSCDYLEAGEPESSSTPLLTSGRRDRFRRATNASPFLRRQSSVEDFSITTGADGGDIESQSLVSCICSCTEGQECNHMPVCAEVKSHLMIPGTIRVPIIGHETMEARSKFTVFKIHVMKEDDDLGWFVFRRYSDFLHLNDQLKLLFPNLRFTLPPKRWFRSNFDIDFLEERQRGLQDYVDNVIGYMDVCNSKPVKDFFCLDDPPGPHDSVEESRAQCECMEEMIYLLRRELADKDTDICLLKEELDLYKNQVQLLSDRLNDLARLGDAGSDCHKSLAGPAPL